MHILKQSTAVTLKVGPFLDESDGKTIEDVLTIAQADVRLAKNGGNIDEKHEATGCTHDELGVYGCPIDATDTNTLGRLQLWVHESGALPIWHEYIVVTANVYASLFDTDLLQVDAPQIADAVWDEATNGHTATDTFGEGSWARSVGGGGGIIYEPEVEWTKDEKKKLLQQVKQILAVLEGLKQEEMLPEIQKVLKVLDNLQSVIGYLSKELPTKSEIGGISTDHNEFNAKIDEMNEEQGKFISMIGTLRESINKLDEKLRLEIVRAVEASRIEQARQALKAFEALQSVAGGELDIQLPLTAKLSEVLAMPKEELEKIKATLSKKAKLSQEEKGLLSKVNIALNR